MQATGAKAPREEVQQHLLELLAEQSRRVPVAVGALFAFLISFDEVVVAYFLSGANTQTLPVKMYTAIRWEVSPVLAAVSTLLTLTSLLFCLGIMALQKKTASESRPVAGA